MFLFTPCLGYILTIIFYYLGTPLLYKINVFLLILEGEGGRGREKHWSVGVLKSVYLSGVGIYVLILLLISTNHFQTVYYIYVYVCVKIISISSLMMATSKRLRMGYCIDTFQGNLFSSSVLRKWCSLDYTLFLIGQYILCYRSVFHFLLSLQRKSNLKRL